MIEAAKRLEERILPLFAEMEREKAEKASLLEEMFILKEELGRMESMERKMTRLRTKLHESNKDLEAALLVAEEVQHRVAQEQEERLRLGQVVQRLHRAVDKKDEELRKTQASLENSSKQVRTYIYSWGVGDRMHISETPFTDETSRSY